ncbi:MAG: SDR family oxidoreductase [Nevskia sp.]
MNALIVGGSRGIGLAFVRALLADAGFERVIAAARAPAASPGLQALHETHGERLLRLALDVSDEVGIERAALQLRETVPALHLLINCAGLLHAADGLAPERRLADVRPDHLLRSYAVNALGPLLVAKHFSALLAHGERAVLANLSARVGSIGDNRLGGWYAYRAAKAAQNQITRTLAIELARRAPNLVCVALHPGTVETELSAPFRGNVAAGKLFTADQSAACLLRVIAGLSRESSGRFYAWDGAEIPW